MNQQGALPPNVGAAARTVRVYRINDPGAAAGPADDRVVLEDTVTLLVEGLGSFTLMCTPTDVEALVVGFAFAEGMIDSADDVVAVTAGKDDPNVVALEIENPAGATTRRNMIIATSCGMCGQRTIEALLERTEPCGRTARVTREALLAMPGRLRDMQELYRVTGASHAAALFDAESNVVAFAEDIGRHTALDKAIGKCLLSGRSPAGCAVALSGRASFEMVAKAARAGIEIIAAVSAPSSFAVEAAERWNVTLCGFVRPPRANVYTHPGRVIGLGR